MRDPRRPTVDEEGDTEMRDTPQSTSTSKGQNTKRKTEQTATPTRSSGRQRKPVQRYAGLEDSAEVGGDYEDDSEEDEDYKEEKSRATQSRSQSQSQSQRSRRATRAAPAAATPAPAALAETKEPEAEEEEEEYPEYAEAEADLDLAAILQQNIQESEESEPVPEYAQELYATLQDSSKQKTLEGITHGVLEKITGKKRVPLIGLDSEYYKVHHLLSQTVTAGEGNSMLVLGSRGSGKTTIVETALAELGQNHANEFHVVRLNGFLHTDDRLALREMWRQLGREMNTEEEAGKVNSYADTMATLLALLSHPDELFGSADTGTGSGTGTAVAARSVVIILDEFDLFVSHARQTLLYNLFDIAQARKAPVAVLGLTTRVDVTEMLEKRVKSRFSHRYVFVPLARSFDMFSEVCFAGLDAHTDDDDDDEVKDIWRRYLHGLWNDDQFRSHLLGIYNATKSVPEFYTRALLAITELHHSKTIPTVKTFTQLGCPDPTPLPFHVSTTNSSSSLPLSLLLAATRLTALHDPGNDAGHEPVQLALSFPAAYSEYVRLMSGAKTSASVSGLRATGGRIWGREVAREAWEKLVSWGLVNAVGSGGSGTADGRMFRVEVSFEEVVEMAGTGLEGGLGRWWRD